MTVTIKLTKMQGCGNDFVIIDYEEYEKAGLPMHELAKKVCDRHFGVGADGLIIPDRKNTQDCDIAWHFYNSDGTTAQMCGNGMRCFAKYVYDKGLVSRKNFSVKTLAGIIKPEIIDANTIKVNMGVPILEESQIPFCGQRQVQLNDKNFLITPVSMGNPHCVIFTQDDPTYLAQNYGPIMESHKYFPEKTNTEFVKVISESEVDMCVYERGCGITLACGTGACAVVVAGVLNNLTQRKVKVNLLGGSVIVDWSDLGAGLNENIFLIGPANYTFSADYML